MPLGQREGGKWWNGENIECHKTQEKPQCTQPLACLEISEYLSSFAYYQRS